MIIRARRRDHPLSPDKPASLPAVWCRGCPRRGRPRPARQKSCIALTDVRRSGLFPGRSAVAVRADPVPPQVPGGHEEKNLLAPDTTKQIEGPDHADYFTAKGDQDRVAMPMPMPMPIVDQLEIVQIDDGKGMGAKVGLVRCSSSHSSSGP